MRTGTVESYRERILRVLIHIQNNLDEELSLDELARVACLSHFHFHRVFRGLIGETVKDHVRRLRLERAASRLKQGADSILNIALASGYETHESFTRAFEAMFEEPPSTYRRSRSYACIHEPPSKVHFAPDGEFAFEISTERRTKVEVQVKRLEKMRVAFVRHIGPYNQVGQTWSKLMSWAGAKGLMGPQTTTMGFSYDDPEVTPPERLRYDAAMSVPDSVVAEGEVGIQETAPGEYAVTTHVGPYEKLNETYTRLCGEWLPHSGRELRDGAALEFYRNSPFNTPPEQLVTEIWMPLA